MRVLTAEAMRSLDAAACAQFTDVALMRLAGVACAAVVRHFRQEGRIVGLAGPGNNGGDAFATLAELDAHYERIAIAFDPGQRLSAARRDAELRARAAGVKIIKVGSDEYEHLITPPAFFLDGLLGVGARAGMPNEMRILAQALNDRAGGAVLALDLPTGIDATTGVAEPDTVKAHATITLGALKLGTLLEHARPYVGELWFDDIGISSSAFDTAASGAYVTLEEATAAPLLPHRPPDADKRASGAPLLLAGSEQFPGAAVLCARAAARAGAGYVTVATPRSAAATLRAHLIEQVVVAFDETNPDHAVDEILDAAKRHGAIAIGPGLGLCASMGTIVRGVIAGCRQPIVIDAGGLFHLAKNLDALTGKNVLLTPHAGEFARLSGDGSLTSPEERLARLRNFVRRHGSVTLLKGRATLIDDGTRVYVNTTGTSALATAGTGDVLTGMIATLLSQGMSPFDAGSLAAYWHGRAGQIAARHRCLGVVAGDLLEVLALAAPQSIIPAAMPVRVF